MDSIRSLVQIFRPAFTAPSFANACFLLLSWIKTSGRAQISEFLRVRRLMPALVPRRTSGKWKHYSVLYRFFSEAKWTLDELGKCLVEALAFALPEDKELVLMIDDTFQKRSGPRILGAEMHYDGSESTASRRTVPFGMIADGFVVLWYLKHGNPETDLKRAKLLAPWYTQKSGISFRDMLEAFRRQMEIEQL